MHPDVCDVTPTHIAKTETVACAKVLTADAHHRFTSADVRA